MKAHTASGSAGMNCLSGAICCIRCMIPVSVAMMKREAGRSVTARIIPSVEAM